MANEAEMLFSFKNKYHHTYLNTYIALYFSYAKVTCKTHTHTTQRNWFPSLLRSFPS